MTTKLSNKQLPDQVIRSAKRTAGRQKDANIQGAHATDGIPAENLIYHDKAFDEIAETVDGKPPVSNLDANVVDQLEPTHSESVQPDNLNDNDILDFINEPALQQPVPELQQQELIIEPQNQLQQQPNVIPEVPKVDLALMEGHDVTYWFNRSKSGEGILNKQGADLSKAQEDVKQSHHVINSLNLKVNDLEQKMAELAVNAPVTVDELLAAGYTQDQIEMHGFDLIATNYKQTRRGNYDMKHQAEKHQNEMNDLKAQMNSQQSVKDEADVEDARVEALYQQVDSMTPGFMNTNLNDLEWGQWLKLEANTAGYTWHQLASHAVGSNDAGKLNNIYRNYLQYKNKKSLEAQVLPPTITKSTQSYQAVPKTNGTKQTSIKMSQVTAFNDVCKDKYQVKYTREQEANIRKFINKCHVNGTIIDDRTYKN